MYWRIQGGAVGAPPELSCIKIPSATVGEIHTPDRFVALCAALDLAAMCDILRPLAMRNPGSATAMLSQQKIPCKRNKM